MSSCAICLEPEMNSPAACVPCGHTFCHACITQWTRSPPRFGLSLCPQCRSPVREVQKLFISDWPVSGSSNGGGGQPVMTQLSAWQQFNQLVTLFIHFVSIPFHSLAHYGPELGRRLTVWLNEQTERLSVLRARLIRCAVICQREWSDLGRQAQCFVGAAFLLVALLLVQDLQDEDGIHRGIVLPILLVLADVVKQILFVAAYVVYRPMSCFLACVLEVGVAMVDVGYMVVSSLLWVIYDVLCVPWLLACVAARLLGSVLSTLAGLVRVCMLCVVVAVSLGLPAILAAPNNQVLRGQLPELIQAGLEWLRQTLLHHTQQAPDPQPQQAPPARQGHRNILREFLRLLAEELRNTGTGGREAAAEQRNTAGERREEDADGGEREDAADEREDRVEEREDQGMQSQDPGWVASSLAIGETLEVR